MTDYNTNRLMNHSLAVPWGFMQNAPFDNYTLFVLLWRWKTVVD